MRALLLLAISACATFPTPPPPPGEGDPFRLYGHDLAGGVNLGYGTRVPFEKVTAQNAGSVLEPTECTPKPLPDVSALRWDDEDTIRAFNARQGDLYAAEAAHQIQYESGEDDLHFGVNVARVRAAVDHKKAYTYAVVQVGVVYLRDPRTVTGRDAGRCGKRFVERLFYGSLVQLRRASNEAKTSALVSEIGGGLRVASGFEALDAVGAVRQPDGRIELHPTLIGFGTKALQPARALRVRVLMTPSPRSPAALTSLREIQSGATLRTGEGFRIEATPDTAGQVVVLSLTADERIQRLFPCAETGDPKPLGPGQTVEIPERRDRFFIETPPAGAERLLFLLVDDLSDPVAVTAMRVQCPSDGPSELTSDLRSLFGGATAVADGGITGRGALAGDFLIDHRAP